MAFDFTAAAALLKDLYTKKKVETEVYKNQPLLSMIPKKDDCVGEQYVVPVIYGNPQSASPTLATTITNHTTTLAKAFHVTWASLYGVATVDNKTILATRRDEGAFVKALSTEIDGMLHQMSRTIGKNLYSSSAGALGVVGAESTTSLTLATISDVTNFEVGMEICAAAAESSGSLRDSGDAVTITAINRSTGVLTSDESWTAISGLVPGDFLFLEGSRNAMASGLAGWIPFTAPDSTAFFGVDRSLDTTRLSGVRYDASGASIPLEEALIEGVGLVEDNGGSPEAVFVNPKQFRKLIKALGLKVQYVDNESGENAKVGFRGVRVESGKTAVTVYPDINCPNQYAYALDLSTWELASLQHVPSIFDTDGNTMLRGTTTDDVQIRGTAYWNLACRAPGWNGVIKLDAAT